MKNEIEATRIKVEKLWKEYLSAKDETERIKLKMRNIEVDLETAKIKESAAVACYNETNGVLQYLKNKAIEESR